MSGGEAPHAPDVVSTGKILMMCDGLRANDRNVPSCFPRQQSLSRWILLEASTVHVAPLRAHLPARMSVSFALRLPDVAGYCVGGRGRRVSRGARPARLHRGSAVFRSKDVASLTTRTRRTRRRRPATSPSASASRDPDQSSPPGNRLVAAALSGLLVASPAAIPGECLVRSSLDHASTSSSSSESTKRSWPALGAPAPLTRAFAASASATPAKLELPAGVASELDAEESANVRLFRENTPSVAFITNKVLRRTSPYSLDATEVPRGAGSGFVWDDAGHVVTNYHVVRDANEVTVKFQGDPKEYSARVLGYDDDKDIAVLEVTTPGRRLRPIPLGRSSALMVGQKLFAIGNPFGLDHTLTTGVVSGVGREIESGNTGRPIAGVIQTDAAINPGNSGGPLLDSSGRLVGVNTAIASPSGAFAGVGFALPIDSVKGIVEQIIQFGRVTRPIMGLVLAPDGALTQLLGPDARDGVLVLGVQLNGPAERAGMRGTVRDSVTGDVTLGDIVVGVNDAPVRNSSDLYRALDELKAGDELRVRVRRGRDAEVTLEMRLGEKVTRFGTS